MTTARKCQFLAIVDGVSKWYTSYCIDRFDAIAQMREIYMTDSTIEVVCFSHV